MNLGSLGLTPSGRVASELYGKALDPFVPGCNMPDPFECANVLTGSKLEVALGRGCSGFAEGAAALVEERIGVGALGFIT